MARLRWAATLLAAVALPSVLGGCVELVVVGGIAAAAGGGYAAGQERGVDGMASDFAIKTDIAKAFTATDPQLQAGITTTVYSGRVLLTGRVANPAMKTTAAQIAGRTHDVRTVHDEIEVAAPDGIWDEAKDTWISTQVRSQLVVDPDIRSVNYSIETNSGSVYLMGSARSQAELNRTTHIARHVPGVKRVISYVEVRGGAPVAAGPPPPTGASAGANHPGAAPRTPIEVQKL
jgi:osmotically-inducible protein OsmY